MPSSSQRTAKAAGRQPAKVAAGAKRHARKPLEGVNRGIVKKLCRRAGLERARSGAHPLIVAELSRFITRTVADACTLLQAGGRRRTLTEAHIKWALKRNGVTFYGNQA